MRKTLFIAVFLPLITATTVCANDIDAQRSPAHQPDWKGSTSEQPWPQQSSHPMQLVKKWEELSQEEKRKVREAQERYKQLPREKKQKLKEKWEDVPKKEKDKYKLERNSR